jgi:poly-gamma-glutamate synthesis protein (capsule biosynthesis protein)
MIRKRRLLVVGFYILVVLGIIGVIQKNKNKPLVIGFTGDVMLGRLVNQVMTRINTKEPGKGYTYVWGNMLPILRQNDINIINLETTLTKSKKKVSKVFNFKADPDKVKALVEAKIDIVSLANNHSCDFNHEGLLETLQVLDKAKIHHVGAGKTIEQARKPVIITRKGIKIGIIGYTDNEPGWKAGPDKPGNNYLRVGDIEQVKKDIAAIRPKVDLLVTTWHWGPNKREIPTPDFVEFAHRMIESGIDIIHGHSAHVTQGVEVYQGKLILYDTGDFVDDYAVGPVLRNDHSFLYKVYVTKEGIQKLVLVPVLIDNMQVNRAKGKDRAEMVQRIKRLSAAFGTEFQEVEQRLELHV